MSTKKDVKQLEQFEIPPNFSFDQATKLLAKLDRKDARRDLLYHWITALSDRVLYLHNPRNEYPKSANRIYTALAHYRYDLLEVWKVGEDSEGDDFRTAGQWSSDERSPNEKSRKRSRGLVDPPSPQLSQPLPTISQSSIDNPYSNVPPPGKSSCKPKRARKQLILEIDDEELTESDSSYRPSLGTPESAEYRSEIIGSRRNNQAFITGRRDRRLAEERPNNTPKTQSTGTSMQGPSSVAPRPEHREVTPSRAVSRGQAISPAHSFPWAHDRSSPNSRSGAQTDVRLSCTQATGVQTLDGPSPSRSGAQTDVRLSCTQATGVQTLDEPSPNSRSGTQTGSPFYSVGIHTHGRPSLTRVSDSPTSSVGRSGAQARESPSPPKRSSPALTAARWSSSASPVKPLPSFRKTSQKSFNAEN
eukprot:Rmarinus@m.22505